MLAPDQLVDSSSPAHISSLARQSNPPAPTRTWPMGRRSVHKFTYENVSKWYWRLLKCCTTRELGTGTWSRHLPACLPRLPCSDCWARERIGLVDMHMQRRQVTHLSLNWTRLRLPAQSEASLGVGFPLRVRVRFRFRFLFCILTTNLHALETVFWALLILTKSRLAYVQRG